MFSFHLKAKRPDSCSEFWKNGARASGKFLLRSADGEPFEVYCDFHSESGWVWTLVMSHSHKNRQKASLRFKSLSQDASVNNDSPNWEAYRLSLERMKFIKYQTTSWRFTCSYPTDGVDYRDYARANFAEFDPFTLDSGRQCKKVEYMNVRGHKCTGCTSAWWQVTDKKFLHHDSSVEDCQFGASPGFVSSEDNFGFYTRTNPAFRCSSRKSASTNFWFGGRL